MGGGTYFVNILGRGYREACAAIQAVNQIVLQTEYAPSDQEFNTEEVVSLAVIESDHYSNEQAVKRCKMLGYLCRGIDPAQDLAEFADFWLACSFQVNFISKHMLQNR